MLWLKGAALVREVYVDPGSRWMGDLDVLVPADQWRAAREAAAAAGAESMAVPGRALTGDRDYVAAFRAPGGAVIELHRYLGPRPLFEVDTGAMIRGGRAGADGFLMPDRADLFVSLALHAAKHGFILAFRGVIDGLALAAAGVDHAAVTHRAQAWRARRATAIWIEMLLRYGLRSEPWRGVADRLGGGLARMLAAGTPFRPGERHVSRLARIAGATDGPSAAVSYLLQRAALRVGDAFFS
jgi:hypothetical protein